MGKHHQANRRKSYGRRQHEVAERRGHDHRQDPGEPVLDDHGPAGLADRLAFLDPRTSRLQFALGD